jgi:cytochrome c biogenesis protein CcmG, thiol:disulfide interchange protein DsbE
MKRTLFFVPLFLFLVVAVYFAVGLTQDPRAIPSVLIDQPVPDFELPPIKGRTRGFTSADLNGSVTLVNVFGSWCAACRIEHPFLMQLKQRGEIPIHGINWREPNKDAGPSWLAAYGDPYTLIGDDPESRAAIAFGVTGAPETFLVDRRGVIRYKLVGPLTPDIWQNTLKPLIDQVAGQ